MGIRTVKPTSPARRYLTYVTYEEITKKEPEKSLLSPKRRTNGRNVYGRITVRHRGGGAKRMLRDVDFRRDKFGIPARVAAIEYDPNRSARLALLHYRDGEKRYIIAPHGLKVDEVVMSGPQADILPGNALPIRNIPVGTLVHNVELHKGPVGQADQGLQAAPGGASVGFHERDAAKEIGAGQGTSAQEGAVHRREAVRADRGAQPPPPEEGAQDVVAPVDHRAGVRRAHAGRPQRQEVHPRVRDREHGRPPAPRGRAPAHVQGARPGREGRRLPDGEDLVP